MIGRWLQLGYETRFLDIPPHPALRATFSRKGEKGADCELRGYRLLPLREKVPEGRMGGFARSVDVHPLRTKAE